MRRNMQHATQSIKVYLAMGDIKKAISTAEHFKVTPKEFGKIVREFEKHRAEVRG